METLAFVYAAVDYEGSSSHSSASNVHRFNGGGMQTPTAAVAGITGFLTVLSFAIATPNAAAFVVRGDICPAVGKVQQALISRDYPVGVVDNVFGESTEQAVRQFQRLNGLVADGVVGPGTAAALGISDPAFIADGRCNSPSVGGGTGTAVVSTPTGVGINVRSAPNGPIVGSLASGQTTSITNVRQTVIGIEWVQLADGNWVAARNLIIGGATPVVNTTFATAIVSTSTGLGINVRSAPNGPIVSGLANGDTVSVTTVRQTVGGVEWIQLADGNWVAARNLRQL